MKIEFCFILFIELWLVISGTKYQVDPISTVDSESSATYQCARNEVFAECGAPCPETCEFLNLTCPGQCRPGGGCVCRQGYVRNDRQMCVPDSYCKPTNCGRNEVFSSCAPLCEQQCNIKIKCLEGCEPKCVCREGFIRNSRHKCIRESQCPPPPTPPEEICFGEHKVYNKCGMPPECTPTCDNLKVNGDFCATVCAKGCFCEDGYVLDQYGECILAEDCPGSNPDSCNKNPNEVYLSCGQPQACVPTCDDPKLNIACATVCVEGCYCKEGYLRNSSGICVRKRNCPKPNNTCTGENEKFYSCGSPLDCTPTCDDRKIDVTCLAECTEGCYCKDGYLKNRYGICVAEKDCPVSNNTCSGANESYLTCGTPLGCTPTCDDRKIDVLCITLCTEGCYCNAGYLRNSVGDCVEEKDCPVNSCPGDNENYQTCGRPEACTPTCDDRKTNVRCANICTEGCYCNDGYLRNDKGNCVLEQDCPPNINTCLGEHKVFTECSRPAPCIPTCENPQNDGICATVCVKGCVCEAGYLINAKGDCIKEENCPQHNPCGANQVYNNCGKLASCLPTCENPNKYSEICPDVCVPGCFCKEGYLMNKNGKCIRSSKCPPENDPTKCDDPRKEYNNCGKPAGCTATCENPINNKFCIQKCNPGCFCKAGYLINKDGKCIRSRNCPPGSGSTTCDDPLKKYSNCGKPAGCTPTCEKPVNNRLCPAVCVPGCFCKEGYLMNKNGKCIRSSKCPSGGDPTTCDDPLKQYSSCGKPAACTATCENPVNNKLCPAICEPGCYCKDGYLINKAGKCILSSKCPPGGGSTTCDDPLKKYRSCGKPAACTPTCENPVNNKLCPAVCEPGCFCKKGYLMNKYGKCIRSSKCPPKDDPTTCIGLHKVFKKCGTADICLPTCENPHNTRPCPNQCNAGCFCEEGYLINQKNDCVREDQCPPQKQCRGDHKYYDSCGKPPGFYPTCENPINEKTCPPDCVGGCYCEEGYLMNKRGDCIKSELCFAENLSK